MLPADLSITKKEFAEFADFSIIKKIDLEHEDLLAVKVMVWFLYFGNYPYFEEDGEDGIFDGLRFSIHIGVYNLATKFDLPCLRQIARRHFRHALRTIFDHDMFLDCIPLVYDSKDTNDLRTMITWQIRRLSLINIMSNTHHRISYLKLFQDFPQFAADVLTSHHSVPHAEQITPRPAAPEIRKPDKGSSRFGQSFGIIPIQKTSC